MPPDFRGTSSFQSDSKLDLEDPGTSEVTFLRDESPSVCVDGIPSN